MNMGIFAVALVITAAPPPASTPAPTPEPPASSLSSPAPISNDSGRLRRCIAADGTSIFTDRRCQDLRAQEEDARPGASPRRGSVVRVRSCARNQDDLLFGVRSALEAHDVNRFADFYHWTGMSSAEGYRLLDRLSVFSERPLVDVQLTSSRRADAYGLDDYFLMPEDSVDDPEFGRPEPPPPPAPDLLRVDQMRSDKDLGSQVTYFRLLTNAGCWWLRF